MSIVKNGVELERWLAENTAFEDAVVEDLEPQPGEGDASGIRLVLGEQIEGTYVAGSERTVRSYVLTARDVLRSTLPGVEYEQGHCCEGIEVFSADDGIGFRIDVPGKLEVTCKSLTIETRPDRRERVAPWTSDREFGATVPGSPVPAPGKWISWFRDAGVEVCWRIHAGEVRDEPPDSGAYEGWYLQEPAGVPATTGGVFFFVCHERDRALVLHWQRAGASEELWKAAKRVVARLQPSQAWCGNCQFSASEWQRFVEDGSLPARLG